MPSLNITQRCQCPFTDMENFVFCGENTVDSELCFVPGLRSVTSVSVSAELDNFRVELVCCDLIVVCGFITKTVRFNDIDNVAHTKIKDIPVQIKVPALILTNETEDFTPSDWHITGVEVCTGCYDLICPEDVTVGAATITLFHKLIEKEIVAVQVESHND